MQKIIKALTPTGAILILIISIKHNSSHFVIDLAYCTFINIPFRYKIKGDEP